MITFIDIIKEKVKYYLRNNKIENNDVKIVDKQIILFDDIYNFYDDYFEFKYLTNTEKLHYNEVDRVSTNNEQIIIETIDYKTFVLKEDTAFLFIEILNDILQSRDNIFEILKMDDRLSKNQTLKLTRGENSKIDVSVIKETQLKMVLLIEAKKYDIARTMLSTISDFSPQNVTNYLATYLQKSEAKFENKPILYYNALIPSLEAVNKDRANSFQLQNLVNIYLEYQNNFFNIPQEKRKFVVITDNFYGVPKKGFSMLLKDYALEKDHPLYHSIDTSSITLPKDMSFPVGHPVVNNVYVVHPYNDKFYIPVEEHEEYLFNDRIDEFKTLVQAFGATEIKFSKEHRLKVNQDQSESLDVNGNAGINALSAKLDYNQTNEQNHYNNNELTYETSQRSIPILKPYVPKNLVWYPKETTWQRMFKQRTGGNNLLGIEEIISSKSHKTVSSNEIMDINVQLKVFFVKAAVHVKKELKSSISEEEEMVQKISVTFASVDQLTKDHTDETTIAPKQSFVKIDYKNKNTKSIPISLIENREPKILSTVLDINIRVPIDEDHNLYLDMIYVEGGTYLKGTDDPKILKISPLSTLEQVSIDNFYISKYTITREQFVRVVKNMFGYSSNSPQCLTKEMIEEGGKIENAFYEFIEILNQKAGLQFKLPNDCEWEYAARGGKYSKGYKYSGSNNVLDVAWMAQSSNPSLNAVGMKKPNELGIHDMSGNIYELVGEGDYSESFLRGGGYWSKEEFCSVYHKIRSTEVNHMLFDRGPLQNDPLLMSIIRDKSSPLGSILRGLYFGEARIGFRVVLPASEIEKLEITDNKEQLVKIKR